MARASAEARLAYPSRALLRSLVEGTSRAKAAESGEIDVSGRFVCRCAPGGSAGVGDKGERTPIVVLPVDAAVYGQAAGSCRSRDEAACLNHHGRRLDRFRRLRL